MERLSHSSDCDLVQKMKHTKLAISIPTYNRPKHIKEYLHIIAREALINNISIYIFDGSESIATENIVKEYIDRGYSNIAYDHRPNREDDHRRGYDKFMIPDADYIWISGDKFMIRPENYSLILHYIKSDYDIITLYNMGDGIKTYSKSEDFFRDCIWCMTHFGSTIIRKKYICPISFEEYLSGSVPGFQHINMFAKALDRDNIKAVFLHMNNKELSKSSRFETDSGTKNRMLEIWIINWYKCIKLLPKRYHKYEKEMLCTMDKHLKWFHIKGLLEIRNQLDLKRCIENRKIIKAVIQVPVFVVFLIAALPNDIATILNYLINSMRIINLRNSSSNLKN